MSRFDSRRLACRPKSSRLDSKSFDDLPSIEGATGRFILQQMASVAELEAGMIGERTKRALAAAKARGHKLGGFRGRSGIADDTAKAREAHTAKARAHAASLELIIERMEADGSLSLRALAAKLTAEGLPTPAGGAMWTAATVARVKTKLAA
jgi:DNA invertase Pin-like site-specific DNA recombinase